MVKYVVTGNHWDDEEYRFPLVELSDVEVLLDHDEDANSVLALTKDDGEVINCDFFNIESYDA